MKVDERIQTSWSIYYRFLVREQAKLTCGDGNEWVAHRAGWLNGKWYIGCEIWDYGNILYIDYGGDY